jgi:hypothetical protein
VAFSAGLPKKILVRIQMAVCAKELVVEKLVIHFRNLAIGTKMLSVAFQAVFSGLMKANSGPQSKIILEFMALHTGFFINPLPRGMAIIAFSHFARMGFHQRPRLGGLIHGKKPP